MKSDRENNMDDLEMAATKKKFNKIRSMFLRFEVYGSEYSTYQRYDIYSKQYAIRGNNREAQNHSR
jgi:hypothetical protein